MGNPNPTVSKRCLVPFKPGETVKEYVARCIEKAISMNKRGLRTNNQKGIEVKVLVDFSFLLYCAHFHLIKQNPMGYIFSTYETGIDLLVKKIFELAKESTVAALQATTDSLKMGNTNIKNIM